MDKKLYILIMILKKSINSLINAGLGIIVIIYITIKADITSFTHDESYSYTRFVHSGFMDIISYKIAFPNNHILNTLLMKFSENILGSTALILRLPNIILLFVFLIYTILFFRHFNKVLSVCMFLFMCSNIYLMDFFGLARGYGLSYGFMIMSFFHIVQSLNFKNPTNKCNLNLVFFNVSALFAILSNFSLFYFYIASLIAYNIYIFIINLKFQDLANKKNIFYNKNKINIFFFFLIGVILYEPFRKILKSNIIDFGGKEGFMKDTVTSIINKYFQHSFISSHSMIMIEILILIPIIISFYLFIKNSYLNRKVFFDKEKPLIIVNLILIIISIETIVQHYIIHTDFLIERFAMFLFPLFVLNTAFLFDYWLKNSIKYKTLIFSIAIILGLLSIRNYYTYAHFKYCADWTYDSETKNAIKKIIYYHDKYEPEKNNVKLGINWIFEPTLNFYREIWDLKWLLPLDRNYLTPDDNYRYIFQSDIDTLQPNNQEVIFSSEKSKTHLIKIHY